MADEGNEPLDGSHLPASPQGLYAAGLLSGGDMTPEAVLSKLSHVLAIEGLDLKTKKKVGLAFRFTFRAFSRHLHASFQSDLQCVHLLEEGETIYRCWYSQVVRTIVSLLVSSATCRRCSCDHCWPHVCMLIYGFLHVPHTVQMMEENLRGEMSADLGAKHNLRDSRFIQVITKSLSISCKKVSLNGKMLYVLALCEMQHVESSVFVNETQASISIRQGYTAHRIQSACR